jgi:hypothetical protein
MLPIFSKKTSWVLLVSLFIFDNIVSYWAVVYQNAREANLAIAWLVEKYPLLYFLCIPATIFLVYIIYSVLSLLAGRLFKDAEKRMIQKVVLTTIVFYWAIGNSSFNAIYLIGYKQPAYVWYYEAAFALLPALVYSIFAIKQHSKKTTTKI